MRRLSPACSRYSGRTGADANKSAGPRTSRVALSALRHGGQRAESFPSAARRTRLRLVESFGWQRKVWWQRRLAVTGSSPGSLWHRSKYRNKAVNLLKTWNSQLAGSLSTPLAVGRIANATAPKMQEQSRQFIEGKGQASRSGVSRCCLSPGWPSHRTKNTGTKPSTH